MKKLLIISFDILNQGEVDKSYSIASILGYLKQSMDFQIKFEFEHLSINIEHVKGLTENEIFDRSLAGVLFSKYDNIALSTYVWSNYLINPFIDSIKKCDFKGKIILGGNEISYSTNEELKFFYPNCDIFIRGYAEKALLEILTSNIQTSKFVETDVNYDELVPVYSSGEISIEKNQEKVRLETKRGCLYNCSFCAHKGKDNKHIEHLCVDKVLAELSFLNQNEVQKINILDPVFNTGNYIEVMGEMVKMKLKSKISLQTRFELIKAENGKTFLNLCENLDVNLEFGLQTIIEEEYKVINRNNNIKAVKIVLDELNRRDIAYETSLIYGLPNQTVGSFQKSIDFLSANGCKKITAFPLMLLKGTQLYNEREKWNLKEKVLDNYQLPYVVSSNSFTKTEYDQMKTIADNLK